MICKIRETIARYNMPVSDKRVVVALSGGADSMALLHVLCELKDEYCMAVEACHVNHGIRGGDAVRDENFVRAECEKLGVVLHTFHFDVPALAKARGLGLEECGRQLRYEAFATLGDCLVATAHTLSDCCETLLLNETRGTSLRGLCSIPAKRDNIVRPLIDCTREEIEAYCESNSVPFVTDDTNFDDVYSRNRVRLNVIPELKKINPSFETAISRLISCANEDEEYFSIKTQEIISESKTPDGYNAEIIAKQHPSVRKRVLSAIIKEETGIVPELVHLKLVEKILDGGTKQIAGKTVVSVSGSVMKINPEKDDDFTEWQCDFIVSEMIAGNRKIKATVFNKNDLPPKQFIHNKVLDYDVVAECAVLRNRRPGDKIRLAGSSCTKTLKKLFNEKHVDGRNNLMILADNEGVLWVEKLGCADRAKITEKTEKILLIEEVAE